MPDSYSHSVRRPLRSGAVLAGAPAVLIVTICSVLPLAWMCVVLLANPQVRSELWPTVWRTELLGRTLGYNAMAAIIATAMGLPAAFVLGRGRGLLTRVLWVVLPAALILPSLSYAYGWSQGVRIVRPFLQPYGITFRPNGPADVFRCVWSLGTWLWAVPAVLVGLSLRRLDSTVQQQAMLDGALRRVTLRQLTGPIVASLAIVTILATQEFAVYEPTGISVVATEVRMVFDTGSPSSDSNSIAAPGYLGGGATSPDQPARAAAAVATALPLVIVTVLLAILAGWGCSKSLGSDEISTGDWPRTLDASRWTVVLTVALVLVNIGVPVAALVGSLRYGFHPAKILSEFAPQVNGALLVGTLAGGLAGVAALFAAARWTRGLLWFSGAIFLVGGQLLAIALIRIYNRPLLGLDRWVYDSCLVTVLAYVGRFGWLAVAAARGTWTGPWRDLRNMAALDGAGPLRTAWFVVWPLAWPVLLAGGLLVGALSLTEVPATVLLMPQKPQVLTPTLMTWVHMARYDSMIEASLLMMAVVIVPAVSAVLLTYVGRRVLRR